MTQGISILLTTETLTIDTIKEGLFIYNPASTFCNLVHLSHNLKLHFEIPKVFRKPTEFT